MKIKYFIQFNIICGLNPKNVKLDTNPDGYFSSHCVCRLNPLWAKSKHLSLDQAQTVQKKTKYFF